MRLSDHQAAFLLDYCKLVAKAVELGFKVTPGEIQRPIAQQRLYIKQGRSLTLNSMHVKKCAGDLNFFLDGKYIVDKEILRPLGEYWESLDPLNKWGGNFRNFKDTPHFQRTV
jgi:hypothetical protein